jgi:hypothetical protein
MNGVAYQASDAGISAKAPDGFLAESEQQRYAFPG